MRKIVVLTLTLVLTLAMVLGMVPAAFAAQHGVEELPPTEVLMWIDETSYTINDEAAEMDVAPFISDDRTFAPVGFVAEAFGLQADWGPREALTEWVTFENGELLVEIEIGSPYITVTEDGEERTVTADVAAQIVEDRTYLPLRAVGEIFGAEFDWGPREAMTEWVSFSYGIAEPVVPEEPPEEIGVELLAEGFTSPVGFVSPEDGSGRMFVVDQVGVIWVLDAEGNVQDDYFLDLRDELVDLQTGFDERGLLGLAFHPAYEQNGRFFVHYSGPLRDEAPEDWDHTAVIAEYRVSMENRELADPASEKVIMEIDQPQFNHNGGDLVFGPDGYLYIPLGDGGGANDVGLGHPDIGNGQDTSTLLGSILRLDIDGGDPYAIPDDNPFVGEEGLDEIFAYGFRNPYRISFDARGDNELFVADVGQDLWEEVNIVSRGGNYGWNIKEGTHCFDPDNPEDPPATCPDVGADGEPLLDPILEYRNARNEGIGIAVIGGYVYRGLALSGLYGEYVFGDWSRSFDDGDGSVFAASPLNGEWEFRELAVTDRENQRMGRFITGIGQDAVHELYLLTQENSGPTGSTGQIYKIVPAGE